VSAAPAEAGEDSSAVLVMLAACWQGRARERGAGKKT
jgi:hypothetical protein